MVNESVCVCVCVCVCVGVCVCVCACVCVESTSGKLPTLFQPDESLLTLGMNSMFTSCSLVSGTAVTITSSNKSMTIISPTATNSTQSWIT